MKEAISTLFLVFSLSVNAVQPLTSELTQVATTWNGTGVVMRFKDPVFYNEGGASCSGRAIMLPDNVSNPLFKENLSLLLSAFHSNSTVTISVDGCEGLDMRVIAVSLEK